MQRVVGDDSRSAGDSLETGTAVGVEDVVGRAVGQLVETVVGARIGARRQLADIVLNLVVVRQPQVVGGTVGGRGDEGDAPRIGLGAGSGHRHVVHRGK